LVQEKHLKDFEDEIDHENEHFLEDDVNDRMQEHEVECLLGLNEDRLHFLEDYLNLKVFLIIFLKGNTMLLIYQI